jgi:hypothetical protein
VKKKDFFITKGGMTMKRQSAITIVWVAVFAFAAMTVWMQAGTPKGEILEYEVISIDPGNWVVTAKETATGNVVKFRLPPSVFKGKTFDFDANQGTLKPGKRFSVRGQMNARLNQLIMENSVPRGQSPLRGRRASRAKFRVQTGKVMGWEILHVDARNWVVTAQNRQNRKIAKIQVHPEAFTGFRFKANLRNIRKGQGFSIVTPNNLPMRNCCTIKELQK